MRMKVSPFPMHLPNGVKHLEELMRAVKTDVGAVCVCCSDEGCPLCHAMMPCMLSLGKLFGRRKAGYIVAYDCIVKPDEIIMDEMVEVVL